MREHWRDPGYWRWRWRNRRGISPGALAALAMIGAAAVGVVGYVSAARLSEKEAQLVTSERLVTLVRRTSGGMTTQVVTETDIRTRTRQGETIINTDQVTVVRDGEVVTVQRPGRTETIVRDGETVVVRRPGATTTVERPTTTTVRETETRPSETVTGPGHTTTETRDVPGPERTTTETTTRTVTDTETEERTVTETETETETQTETVTETVTEPKPPKP